MWELQPHADPWDNLRRPVVARGRDQDGLANLTKPTSAAAAADGCPRLLENPEWGFLMCRRAWRLATGLTNWNFARGEWLQGDGDLMESKPRNRCDRSVPQTDSSLTEKYVAGANWYPVRRLNMGDSNTRFVKRLRSSTDPAPNATGSNRYPAFFRSQTSNGRVNFRVTWRPLDNLTLMGTISARRRQPGDFLSTSRAPK